MPTIQFKGKSFVQNHHLAVPYHQLVPDKKKSLTDKVSLHDNLIIHGDNLLALKALLPTYAGKVKCIYIDPPYNTGNEGWIYNDNVKSPIIKEWIGKVVGREGEDLTRHDKWLCMMMPRLKLLRELLTDDGVIIINIETNEYANLQLLLNEIFGEENCVGTFIWRKKEGGGQTKTAFVIEHEYVLIFQKTKAFHWIDEIVQGDDSNFIFSDAGGKYKLVKLAKWGNTARKEDRPKMHFPIISPSGTKLLPIAPDGTPGRWRVGKARMSCLIEEGLIEYKNARDGQLVAYEKVYFSDEGVKTIKERSIIYDLTNTADASKQLTEIFREKDKFDNAKPVELVKYFLSYVTVRDSIILDSFAGSGTTAQAVLELNKEDGGNRKFILVEMEDYADKITAERIHRVIKGVPNSSNHLLKEGLGGTFSYFELGDPIEISNILSGKALPTYLELARYVYYTATGEEFDESKLNEVKNFIGRSKSYDIYMYYKPDIDYLKTTALTLDEARNLRKKAGKRPLLVFAPTKYVEQTELDNLQITFCQLPFEIYKVKG